jgi:CRISPR-associated endonuclease/helicase Cas3
VPSLKEAYSQMMKKGFFDDKKGKRKRKERKCLNVILEVIEKQILQGESTLTFIQLPPGYGKTAIPYSLSLWALSSDNIYLERSIHVLPLRSIVEDSWKRFKEGLKNLGLRESDAEGIAGAQCMFIHGSPFLQKILAVTTLDTFTLLAAKLPPAEIRKITQEQSQGHYEIARGALFSSALVFDEAHLFLEEKGKKNHERSLTALLTLTRTLLRWRIPVIIMTATLPYIWRQEIEEWLRDREPGSIIRILTYNENGLKDNEFEDEINSVKMCTKLLRDDAKYVEKIAEATKSYEHVLVVANTIRRAQDLYEKLKDYDPILLHSKFTQRDRESKLRKITDERRKWLCISTQVIEAGVNISAQSLFTDIAPLCALVQRSGRCCRPSYGDEEGEVTINISEEAISHAYKIYNSNSLRTSEEILEKLNSSFNWHSYTEYMPLLERAYGEHKLELNQRIDYSQSNQMLQIFLHPYWIASDTFNLLLELGSLTRDEPLIPGIVCENEKINDVTDIFSENKGNFISLEFDDLCSLAKRCKVRLLTINKEDFDLRALSNRSYIYKKILYGEIIAVQIPPEFYNEERGLLI